MQVSIYRYNPDVDEVPVMRDMSIDLPEGKDLMVLDVLELLKGEDPSLTYRRSCREGVCGSDGINMNGRNGLACITPVSEVAKRGKLVLRPLPGPRESIEFLEELQTRTGPQERRFGVRQSVPWPGQLDAKGRLAEHAAEAGRVLVAGRLGLTRLIDNAPWPAVPD